MRGVVRSDNDETEFKSDYTTRAGFVVAFSSSERILGEWSTIHCPSALLFPFSFLFFKVDICSRTLIPLFYVGISQHWLSGPRNDT